ncbi:hypothetical protein SAMN05421805_12812 [Saccharopolyspora antimicrobica]|uniref:DUF6292 domain-containing protein n=1 Tax=Saccharopolyspora antimicrobica TaxID=455193 RepID=A0A1I5KU68_9PSEU|nr:DUF6292 family protein [Saccharopolyspora antimicrobica]RKT89135.1 hypothetical protein ATL45_7582 [Saccharopolyspora antimicrobica]SFO88166.1 hypothetical protein SAMN05421805_12812 [Saccharopolyspora antimicrobica]
METTSRAVGGLVNYVRSVAGDLGDEIAEIDVDVDGGLATVIIQLHSHVPTLIGFPLLLTWDEVSGWALRVEAGGAGRTVSLEFLGENILPPPEAVREFLRDAIRGRNPGTPVAPAFRLPNSDDGLESRLARFDC